MNNTDNTQTAQPRRTTTYVLATIACALLVWLFTYANPWLIGIPVVTCMGALVGYVIIQQRRIVAETPENIISLEKELRAREEAVASLKMQEALTSVLVVEDNVVALKTLSRLFAALGAKSVTEATSAEQALDLLQKHKYTFILTDYRLGGMNGVQMLEKIRGSGNETPVVILSATPDQTGVLRVAAFDRTDFFRKPLRRGDLTEAINRLSAN